ncbi:VOC family protein [Microcella alkaliphila]|uniref:Glyoxalase/bleomycin resistance protein/dioxygenase n=1 Tax=Microcella alkaliphila TaxID=279828 RepID=A0A0U5BQR7_9MICO|nr:VOC family protein [Microcella alkaliphila]BAU33227.1 glyoxalase/bleomycin resistance protein/dioxygenase [Microcella alkaliphila]
MTHGIPGLRGTEHIGFTVPDLDAAEDFFVTVIGCERIYSLGPYVRDDDWMSEHLNVHPRTVIRELRFFRCKHGPNFEIFEYESADGQNPQPRNSDIGGHHLAFYVDDMDVAVAYLRSNGVRVLGEPTASTAASEGQRWVYFLAPWGMQLELVSFPNGKAYEATSDVRLWDPRNPSA